ncbi:MAG: Na+/H+ antiporter NhaA [Proteobacteria bacterium]|nr:Na+/H+ antiporter NhaA [Pseudomonadota bacterium]
MNDIRAVRAIRAFLANEASGGIVLMIVAALALVIANSPLAPSYFATLETKVAGLSVLHWINDALMAIFFLLVGLEVKREFIEGELSTWPARALPGLAAAGGVIVPALIYVALNRSNPEAMRGWAIPTATDIAFALGVLALLGSRIPTSLKVFLAALAIIDDLAAIIIIAVFYTTNLSALYLAGAAAGLAALAVLNRRSVTALWPYLLIGIVVWFMVLKSGIHATLAGVAVAMAIPLVAASDHSPLHRLEHALHKPVGFIVVPVFGLANAGVSFAGMTADTLLNAVPLGIALGLFVGKLVGVYGASWVAIRTGLARCPEGATMTQLFGVAMLCGIGFTMSLFIGLLAFPDNAALQDAVKVGVLMGSIVSALAGLALLSRLRPDQQPKEEGAEALS